MTIKKTKTDQASFFNSLEAAKYILRQVKETGLAVIVARESDKFESLKTTDSNKVEAYLRNCLGPEAERVEYEDSLGKSAVRLLEHKMSYITGGIICTAGGRVTMECRDKNMTAILWGKPFYEVLPGPSYFYPGYKTGMHILPDSALDKIKIG